MHRTLLTAALLAAVIATPALALTPKQQIVMQRHGSWEWSIRTCPGIHRGKRYWYFLREAGDFARIRHIIDNENGPSFHAGWQEMERHAGHFGTAAACDLAMQKWPAILWRGKKY
jgi:hypothetical protein